MLGILIIVVTTAILLAVTAPEDMTAFFVGGAVLGLFIAFLLSLCITMFVGPEVTEIEVVSAEVISDGDILVTTPDDKFVVDAGDVKVGYETSLVKREFHGTLFYFPTEPDGYVLTIKP